MPTSIHLPKRLLAEVDQRARSLKMSRNRFIVLALANELKRESEWSPGFFDRLRDVDSETTHAVDEMLRMIRRTRKSKTKGPPL
jgi:predicted transcriptional regulator